MIRVLSAMVMIGLMGMLFQQAQAQMTYQQVEEGDRFFFKVPAEWRPMTIAELEQSTHQTRKAHVAYTHPKGRANFIITLNETPWAGGGLNMLLEMQKSNVMYLYDNKVRIMTEETRNINGRLYAILEFVGRAELGTRTVKKYNLVSYSIYGPMAMVSVFSCENRYRAYYQDVAWEVLKSLKVKENLEER